MTNIQLPFLKDIRSEIGAGMNVGVRGDKHRAVRGARGQQGLTLVEVMISIVLIAILVAALSASILTVSRASAQANEGSRASVLLTSFGETLQQLSYQTCSNGDLVAVYEESWRVHNEALPEEERLVPVAAESQISVEISSVDTLGGCRGGEPDKGEQVLEISATVRGVTRSGQVVKTDPDFNPRGPVADITARRISSAGDAVGIFALTAGGSTPLADIASYEWNCGDGDGSTPDTTFSTADPEDPAVECDYIADPAQDTVVTVELRVTDIAGVTGTATRDLTVPRATSPRAAPVAEIAASPSSGNASLTVTFSPAGSASLDGTIVEYRWNFGDPNSGASNTLTTESPTTPEHVYERAGVFPAKLTVVDEIGLTGTATVNVTVNRPGPPPPIASFTMTPSSGVSPQTVSFDASGSRPDTGGAAIVSYEWDFGNGAAGGGVTASRPYTSPDTYTVRLTVTDTAGASATTTRTLPIRAFINPPDFRLTGSQPEFFSDGKFFFAWTNVGASPGDSVTYKISVKVVEGCLVFGEKSRTVNAGAAGSPQTYTFTVGWPASNVCAGSQYAWRVETIRANPADGTRTTDATPWKHFWV